MAAPDQSLIAAAAAEIDGARAGLDDLAGRVTARVRDLPAGVREAALVDVQTFDALGQRLHALAILLAGLGRGAPASELIAAVPLADMAARLGGASSTLPAAAGDLMLFD